MARASGKTFERFDDSFVVRTIRDFFISLLLIIAVELAVRFALVLREYETVEAERTELAAERLADDVRSIMLNRGGPVAARTIYPIIERNHDQLGLDIAIEPHPDTVAPLTEILGSEPRGIPQSWDNGAHHEARRSLEAEQFCISCHATSEPGDTLGYVTVRNYRSAHVADWLREVWLSGLFGMGNIMIHTVVLFVVLRLRMEPLLSLCSVVSRLSKAGSDLSHRAPVRSGDEFGELAHDLNLFLDRLSHITEDMARVLAEIDAIAAAMLDMGAKIYGQSRSLSLSGQATGGAALTQTAALGGVLETLEAMASRLELDAATTERLAQLRAQLARAGADDGPAFHATLHELGGAAGEIQVLEERMRALAGEGQRLLARLGQEPRGAQEQPQASA